MKNFLIFILFFISYGNDIYKNKLKELHDIRYEVFTLQKESIKYLDLQKNVLFISEIPFNNLLIDNAKKDHKKDHNLDYLNYSSKMQIYNNANDKSGFFIGFGIAQVTISNFHNNLQSISNSFLISPRAGYIAFFNQYFGARITGSLFSNILNNVYDYNAASGAKTPIKSANNNEVKNLYLLGTLSFDLLLEFPINYNFNTYLGSFVGFGVGGMYYRNYENKTALSLSAVPNMWDYLMQVDYALNVGTNIVFNNKHRIELAVNIPCSYLQLPGFAQSVDDTMPVFVRSYIIALSYNMKF